ncbi:MAG: ribonuclease-3 [Gammaproteobacteria bacterium]|jgi:ribonuclease-3
MSEWPSKLENAIDYKFEDKALFETALTHRSIGRGNNERLEYLGDAALGFIIADAIFKKFPEATEGELTRLRSSLVKGETLAELARELNLGDFIKLGPGERKSGGWRRDSILANTLEAIIGAVYLDSDMEVCRRCVVSLYKKLLSEISPGNLTKDSKTSLQELLQSRQMELPVYHVLSENGEAHERIFTIECSIKDQDISVQAEGNSKRIAEQVAAEKALSVLESQSKKIQ